MVVLKTHLQILWCTSHQEMESVCLPLEPEWAFMILLTSEARLEKTLQFPFGSLTWGKDLGSPELPWKKFVHTELPCWRDHVKTERDAQGTSAVRGFPAQVPDPSELESLQMLLDPEQKLSS